jgi:hypothetical protein
LFHLVWFFVSISSSALSVLSCEGENMKADEAKLAFSWKPPHDYDWKFGHRFNPEEIKLRPAPAGKVFFVHGTPNGEREEFPSIDCWINHWGWVEESPTLPEAPIDHETRYRKRLK